MAYPLLSLDGNYDNPTKYNTKTINNQFTDSGYLDTSSDGRNGVSHTRSIDVNFTGLATKTYFENFFNSLAGRKPFQFNPYEDPSEVAVTYICEGFDITYLSNDTYNLKAEFSQVFRHGDTFSTINRNPLISFSGSNFTVTEGQIGYATVLMDKTFNQVVTIPFTVSGTATNNVDYRISPSPLRIPPGATGVNIAIEALTDTSIDINETVIITLGTPSFGDTVAPTSRTVTIAHIGAPEVIPTVSFSSGSQSVVEGNNANITVNLSNSYSLNTTVPYTLSGTSTTGTDYTITPSSPLVFTAGSTSRNISITTILGKLTGTSETIVLTLGTPTNGVLGGTTVHTATVNKAALPTIQFSTVSSSVNEGSGVNISMSLSKLWYEQITVPYILSGSAINGVDYQTFTSPLVIAINTSPTNLFVNALTDSSTEPSETVILTLGTPTNATLGTNTSHTVTIVNVPPPTVSFISATSTVIEGSNTSITLNLSSTFPATVTVPYTLSGTAVNETDYTLSLSSPISIVSGQTTANILLTALGDILAEGNETVVITLGTPTNATLGATSVHTTTISNGAPIAVSFNSSVSNVSEGSNINIPLTLSATSGSIVTVPYTVSGTATNTTDYTLSPSSPINIPSGQTTVNISLTALGDNFVEGAESVILTLGSPTNATLGTTTTHTSTINNVEDAFVTAWVNNVVVAGGTVAENVRTAMDVFVKGLKIDGLWTIMSTGLIIPFSSNTFAGALVPLVIPSGRSLTNNNFISTDYSLTTGLDPGSVNSTKRITSNISLTDLGLSATSVQISVYQNLVRSGQGNVLYSGTIGGQPRLMLHAGFNNVDTFDSYTFDNPRIAIAKPLTGGLTSGSRIPTITNLFRNGVSVQSIVQATTAFNGTQVITMLEEDRSRTCYISCHQGLTAAQETLHYNRVQALQTALGRQV